MKDHHGNEIGIPKFPIVIIGGSSLAKKNSFLHNV